VLVVAGGASDTTDSYRPITLARPGGNCFSSGYSARSSRLSLAVILPVHSHLFVEPLNPLCSCYGTGYMNVFTCAPLPTWCWERPRPRLLLASLARIIPNSPPVGLSLHILWRLISPCQFFPSCLAPLRDVRLFGAVPSSQYTKVLPWAMHRYRGLPRRSSL